MSEVIKQFTSHKVKLFYSLQLNKLNAIADRNKYVKITFLYDLTFITQF